MKKIRKYVLIGMVALLPVAVTFQSCDENGNLDLSSLDKIYNSLLSEGISENTLTTFLNTDSSILTDLFNLQKNGNINGLNDLVNSLLEIISQTGWWQNNEDGNNIPVDPTPPDNNNLPQTASLEKYYPPIGDQGQYGTCVVWSVGYNTKTALNAKTNNWSTSDLANKANQTSPKDLWFAIPSSDKGSGCNGTNFEPAMEALIKTGAASLSNVPYSSLGSCTGSAQGSSGNKLLNYRKIAYKDDSGKKSGMTVDNFKAYLNAGSPIAFGAQLGDRFMSWSSASVITSDTYNNPGMQHAYHAMALVGYDDGKQAFRVRNSWGTSWGDNGSIWVGYNFFINSFCFAAFVAENPANASAAKAKNTNSGYDLMTYYAGDYSKTGNRNREVNFQIYNSGDNAITANQKWSFIYMYYNAVDANDYGILVEQTFSNLSVNELLSKTYSYTMPNITGKYYLVAIANPFGDITEGNKDNNFYFITSANSKPIEFKNGVAQNMVQTAKPQLVQPQSFGNLATQSVVKAGNLNAYSSDELQAVILHDKETGRLK